ncbi:MAG TPA: FIST N-terminal domain-containing protein [Candidatus Sulfotelmatobacter sp.]|nr:FIST N-terminal domain-containing protein [Candidatus Sulfotelmatobacter sp.]
MLRMAVGQSDDVDGVEAIRAAIEQCREQLGGATARAGLMFATFDAFEPTLVREVRGAFPGIRLIGSSSSAEMSSVVGYREDSVTLAVFASDTVRFTAAAATWEAGDVEAACRRAAGEVLAATDLPPRLCFMVSDAFEGQFALDAVRGALPAGTVVVGGGSSAVTLGSSGPAFQACDDAVQQHGIALLLMSGPLAFSVAVGTGLRPVGPTGVVTRAVRGRIEDIDGHPATAFTSAYLDVAGPATFGNPLAVCEAGASAPYLRVLLGQDQGTGALEVVGAVPTGATVQLTTATSDEIVAATADTVRRAAEAFPDGRTPSAALIFSCAVRKFLLGTRTGQELGEARSQLPPDLPVAGMYCSGEIAPVDQSHAARFLNETFVTVLLGADD